MSGSRAHCAGVPLADKGRCRFSGAQQSSCSSVCRVLAWPSRTGWDATSNHKLLLPSKQMRHISSKQNQQERHIPSTPPRLWCLRQVLSPRFCQVTEDGITFRIYKLGSLEARILRQPSIRMDRAWLRIFGEDGSGPFSSFFGPSKVEAFFFF